MILIRFMSNDEFSKLISGQELYNDKIHSGFTNSIGFCFFEDYGIDLSESEDAIRQSIESSINYNIDMLSGIVSNDVCVVFDSLDAELILSKGRYADPYGAFFGTIWRAEYCIEHYNKHMIKPLYSVRNFDIWFNENIKISKL